MTIRSKSGAAAGFVLVALGSTLTPGVAHADDTTPPSTPANLREHPSTVRSTITWDPSTDDSGQVIYTISYAAPDGPSDTGQTTDTTFTIGRQWEAVLPPATYTVTVTAMDLSGNVSAAATIRTTIRLDTDTPSTPANLRFVPNSPGDRDGQLRWNPSTDNSGDSVFYELIREPGYRGEPRSIMFRTTGTELGTAFLVGYPLVSRGETLTLRVQARDLFGHTSPLSAPITHTF